LKQLAAAAAFSKKENAAANLLKKPKSLLAFINAICQNKSSLLVAQGR